MADVIRSESDDDMMGQPHEATPLEHQLAALHAHVAELGDNR